MRRQKGFTLVELIVVIVILGILAAMALPRFAGMQGDARLSKMQGLLGSMRSASTMAHSAQLVTINSTHATEVTIEGNKVAMVNGYPTAKGILVASGLLKEATTGATSPAAGALGDYYLAYYDGTTNKVAVVAPDESRKNQCVVVYVESTGLNNANAQSGNPPLIGIFDNVKALGLAAGSYDTTATAVGAGTFSTTDFDKKAGQADKAHDPQATSSDFTDATKTESINGRDCE